MSGFFLIIPHIILHYFEPMASEILTRRALKFVCYASAILGLNFWIRTKARLDGVDPNSAQVWKRIIKLSLFILTMFGIMEMGVFMDGYF